MSAYYIDSKIPVQFLGPYGTLPKLLSYTQPLGFHSITAWGEVKASFAALLTAAYPGAP